MGYSLRQKIGAAVLDWPRFEIHLRRSWAHIRNRREMLLASPDGSGVACQWNWSSDLHVAKVFPSLGARLIRRAIQEWPITFADAPRHLSGDVQVTFIIGHRGMERAPQLLATLATIAAQRDVKFECIVVEQAETPDVRSLLPDWVRHVHTPPPDPKMPYCRSWTLNVGARLASGELLVFHDNDMLVPEAYAAELWRSHEKGFEVVNLKRFVFYLSVQDSKRVQSRRKLDLLGSPDAVVQNLEAGGSLAVKKDAFFAIGGFDESFIGWGGEDNEFWERAQTLRLWPYADLPFVHLWHEPQAKKYGRDNPTLVRYKALARVTAVARITELRKCPTGELAGPAGYTAPSGSD